MKIGKITKYVALISALFIALLYSPLYSYFADQVVQLGTIYIQSSGATQFIASTNATTTLSLLNNATGNTDVAINNKDNVTVGGSNFGVVTLPVYTKAQVDALTPTAANQLILETGGTLSPQLCISTGTTISGFRAAQGAAALGCGTGN